MTDLGQVVEEIRRQRPEGEALVAKILNAKRAQVVDDIRGLFLANSKFLPHRQEVLVSLIYSMLKSDRYIGLDSHLPSRFAEVHPFLLESLAGEPSGDVFHLTQQAHECHGGLIARIILKTRDELLADFEGSAHGYWQKYLNFHAKQGWILLTLPLDRARQLVKLVGAFPTEAHRPEIPRRTDVGMWPQHCALLFEPPENVDTRVDLSVAVPGERAFEDYIGYVRKCLDEAEFIRLEPWARDDKHEVLDFIDRANDAVTPLEYLSHGDGATYAQLREDLLWGTRSIFEPNLLRNWSRFVSPDRRAVKTKQLIAPLIERLRYNSNQPDRPVRVLDAALGLGVEATALAETNGGKFEIIGNEIEETLIAAAEERSRSAGFELNVRRYDWRHLAYFYEPGYFDLVLLLGNSLSCLSSWADINDTMRSFHKILRPGGLLVLDERNYRQFGSEGWTGGLAVKMKNRLRRLVPGAGMYQGEDMKAVGPKPDFDAPDNRRMDLEYFDWSQNEVRERIGTFTVFPFRDGELEAKLDASKFSVIEHYYDFEAQERGDAEFITYVAERRQ